MSLSLCLVLSCLVLTCLVLSCLVLQQVASYFSKLLREEGDVSTKVALVTDEMVYNPLKKFDMMPQIVVGTPFALESALTKARGIVGRFEMYKKTSGDILPGGFDHFDWVVFDEVPF